MHKNFFFTQIDHSHVAVQSGAACNLFAVVLTMQVVQFDTFADIRKLQNLFETDRLKDFYRDIIAGEAIDDERTRLPRSETEPVVA